MKIEVTQEDIEKGIAQMCEFCPVALAVARAFDVMSLFVSVSQLRIMVRGKGNRPSQIFITPPKAAAFIDLFDTKKPVHPFTFELDYKP